MPFAGHALELVSAAILEGKPGSDHEVAPHAGHEHVVRPGQGAHPRADVHANTADVIAATSHSPVCSPARTSMPSEETVARRVHLAAAKTSEL
jgi:hypothetical protein